jgi:hypothetical protein
MPAPENITPPSVETQVKEEADKTVKRFSQIFKIAGWVVLASWFIYLLFF